jgi:hypothetical protein
MPTKSRDPIGVEIRLEGHLDQCWSAELGGLTLTHEADGTTALRGGLADQAQLHGVLVQIRDLGATLISLTRLDAGSDAHSRSTPSPLAPRAPNLLESKSTAATPSRSCGHPGGVRTAGTARGPRRG